MALSPHSPPCPFAVLPLAPNTLPGYPILGMAHLIQNKKKLLARISRIRGQLNGIEKALDADRDCGEVLLTLAACRGALNSLMAEILEDHVRQHVLGAQSAKDREVAAEELIEVIKRYLK
jgi:DNA-binding FrmR family transcriptional regulator